MNKEMQGMNWKVGPGNKQNQDKWNLIVKKMSGDKWKGQMGSDKDLKQQIDSLWNSWKKWQTDNGITPSAAGMFGDTKLEKDDAWIPERAYRIDVTTNFDENWYKRKFKSGMLNKLIVGLKNQAMSFTPDDIKQKYGDKKYSVDDMTDADKSKLDGIKWKMTNKITTAYITYLLGWKRKKEYTKGEGDVIQEASKLEQDSGFGKKMAEKALGGRGVIGRMKQKLFAGGQNSNVISVAFQPADWRDGWKMVESGNDIEGAEGDDGEGGKDGKGGEGGSGNGSPGSGSTGSDPLGTSGGSGGGSGSGAGSNGQGAVGGANGSGLDLLQRVVRIEDKMTDNDMWGDV